MLRLRRPCGGFAAAIAVVAAAIAGCRGAPRGTTAGARPDILLVTIDTLRADRIGTGIAPTLDRLADRGLRFTSARTAVPLTLPSHATIMTGLLPPAHGVRENGSAALADGVPTIARLLKSNGYRTAAFVGAFVLDRRFGLSQGFDTYDDRIPRDPNAVDKLEAERPAEQVVDAALAWLSAERTVRPVPPFDRPDLQEPRGSPDHPPFFMWIHLYDPHAPYNPPPRFLAMARERQASEPGYDGEIAYADSQVARVLDALRQRRILEQTLVIVAGDHGEGLGDHGENTHGMLLYDSTLRVPLLIAGAGQPKARRDDPVSLADIAPTILSAAGVAPPPEMKGRNVLDVRRVRLQPDLYAETEYPRVAGWSRLQALTDGRWKAIRAGGVTEVYDLQSDPREERNVAAAQRPLAAAMIKRIDEIRTTVAPSAARTLSADAQQRLRALGYVASAPETAAASANLPNPSGSIADWNAFENALSSLNSHRPSTVPALAALVKRAPNAPVFHATYARALLESGRTADALDVYRRAARRWPTDATLLHDLAVAARQAGRPDEARQADEAAVALAPSSAIAHNGLGLIAVDENRPADAARAFERAATVDPTNGSYWTNLGNARRSLHDAAGAERAYRQALDVDAGNADAANGLGVLFVETQRPAQAVPWFERAVRAQPDFVEARLNLGIALQQSGDAQKAAETYRAILRTSGSHPREKEAASKLLASIGPR